VIRAASLQQGSHRKRVKQAIKYAIAGNVPKCLPDPQYGGPAVMGV